MLSNQEINLIRQFNRQYVLGLGVLNKKIFNTNLSWPEGRILEEIGKHQPVMPITIANFLKTDKSYVSRIIKQLVKKDLVEKKPSPFDGRSVLLCLTNQGQEMFKLVDQRSTTQIQNFISSLSSDEQHQFFTYIQQINHLLFERNDSNVGS